VTLAAVPLLLVVVVGHAPDDAVDEVLLAVLGCVWAIDVQGLKHSEGQALRLEVALNCYVACSTGRHSTNGAASVA
jgi:hypothetical protein